MNDNNLIHPNLVLAREYFSRHVEFSELWEEATRAIFLSLECKGLCDGWPYLPGDTLSDIVANLNKALNLCHEPAALPSTGRNRELRQRVTASERNDLALCIRVCLALLGAGCAAGAQP